MQHADMILYSFQRGEKTLVQLQVNLKDSNRIGLSTHSNSRTLRNLETHSDIPQRYSD